MQPTNNPVTEIQRLTALKHEAEAHEQALYREFQRLAAKRRRAIANIPEVIAAEQSEDNWSTAYDRVQELSEAIDAQVSILRGEAA